MKQYRLLWSSISTSRKIRKIEGSKWFRVGCHLVYTWLIPWGDDDGRLRGETLWILANILPNEDLSIQEIDKSLVEIERVGLILRYSVDGEQFIQISDWTDHQRIRKDRHKSSSYPTWQPDVNQASTSPKPVTNHTGDGDGDKGESEGKDKKEKMNNNFNVFWQAYPLQKVKKKAMEEFERSLKKKELPTIEVLLLAIEAQKKEKVSLKEQGAFCPSWPHPSVWLKNKRWEDEVEVKQKTRYAT